MSADLATERDKMDCAFLRAHAHYLNTGETKRPYVNSALAIGETGRRVADRMEAKDAEIARLQEAKRRALAIADERAIEANGVRAENERLRRTETCARLVLKAWETAGAATAQPLTDSIVRLRDALAAEQTS